MIKRDLGLKDFGTLLPGPRRDPRPLRRHPVLPARRLLPGPSQLGDRVSATRRRAQGRRPRLDRFGRHPGARRHPATTATTTRSSRSAAGRNAELLDGAGARVRRRRRPGARVRRRSATRSPSSPRIPTPTSCSTPSSGFAGLPATLAALEQRQAARAGQQGEPHRRRPGRAAAARARRRRDRPGRLRALGALPGAAGRRAERGRARLILTASGGPFRGRTRAELERGHRRRRAEAPHLEHGRQDHDRLVDAHEQGARGDRGPRAVRRRLRPDRRRRAPAVGDPRHGRVHRRRHHRPAVDARHAPPDRPRPRRARPPRRAVRRRSTGRRLRHAHVRAARPRGLPVPARSPTRPAGPAAAPRRRSAGPTRSRSRRSSTAGSRGSAIADVVDEVLAAGTGNVRDVADVLEADRVARERAPAPSIDGSRRSRRSEGPARGREASARGRQSPQGSRGHRCCSCWPRLVAPGASLRPCRRADTLAIIFGLVAHGHAARGRPLHRGQARRA